MEKLAAVERFIKISQGLTEEEARLKFKTDIQYRKDAEATAAYIVETIGPALEKAVEAISDLVKSLTDQIKSMIQSLATYAKEHPEAVAIDEYHQEIKIPEIKIPEIKIPEIPIMKIGSSCITTPQSFTRGG